MDGKKYFQVDARRKGTTGKREAFPSRKDAEARASEIEEEFSTQGREGLAMDGTLRVMALQGRNILQGYNKTIADAVNFYQQFLEHEKRKLESATVEILADAWLTDKSKKKGNKILRKDTIDSIAETSKTLKKVFGGIRILEVTKKSIQDYLDGLNVEQRRKFNVCSLFSQFFNWCIDNEHTTKNPAKEIEIVVPKKDVRILSVKDCKSLMKKCETEYPDLLIYHAVCLFAGLRPTEAKLLSWENIHQGEKQIKVLGITSKNKESRNVDIQANLQVWLDFYTGNKSGAIVQKKGLRTRLEKFRVSLGYQVNGENPDADKWTADILRHTFASYWIAKYKERGQLAEQMGNSLKMIKDHYKAVVTNSDTDEFWKMIPSAIEEQQARDQESKKNQRDSKFEEIKQKARDRKAELG